MAPPARLLLLALALAAPAALASGSTVGCGSLAPFENHCVAGTLKATQAPVVTVNALGFAGEVEVRLQQVTGALVVRCTSFLAPEVQGVCSSEGGITLGALTTVTCTARAAGTLFPAGTWGCKATL